jgi:hypothetical protein
MFGSVKMYAAYDLSVISYHVCCILQNPSLFTLIISFTAVNPNMLTGK